MYGLVANTALRDPGSRPPRCLWARRRGIPRVATTLPRHRRCYSSTATPTSSSRTSSVSARSDRARGPKGLLTIVGGAHGSAAALSSPAAAPQVLAATTDFFDVYLSGDPAAAGRLPDDQLPGVTTMKFVAEPGSTTTIPTVPTPKLHLKAGATPTKNLTNGQLVTVTWSGYSPGKVINILECNGGDRG